MTHLSRTRTTLPTEKQADEWLRKNERSGLPRLMWLLTIYEVEDGIEK